ncbi:MAG: cobyric acid synthase [Pseudomonadota bacterium]
MLQGTASDVGKSLITMGLCRLARRRGVSVAPFKPQNMSNNAAACAGGGEIGRAQALQALAAGLEAHPDMNPVLLKPESDRRAQIVVHGKVAGHLGAADYLHERESLRTAIDSSFGRLRQRYDLVLVEGAGSPAETNLRQHDLANMGFATRADVPVCLIGDIDRGGVIANIVGTQAVLAPEDNALICGFLVNKFRGDPALFESGRRDIEARTAWPCFGVMSWASCAARLPAEDAVVLQKPRKSRGGALRIVAPMLSRIANFDDADPLLQEEGVAFEWVPPGEPIPRDADVVILFGSKSTTSELSFLRSQGWDHDILAHARTGGRVLGLCGGYQMLGEFIHDPHGYDGLPGTVDGLSLLRVSTTMGEEKTVQQADVHCANSGLPVRGYEIHVGDTDGPDCDRPVTRAGAQKDGATSPDGLIEGSYIHGLLTNDDYRRDWLLRAGADAQSRVNYQGNVDAAIDEFADAMEADLDIDALLDCAA